MLCLSLVLAVLAAEPAEPAVPPDAGSTELPDAATAAEPARPEAPVGRPAPAALLRFLRQKTTGNWCARDLWTSATPLRISRWLELKDGGLLLFVQLADYLCQQTNSAVPVVVSTKGQWSWGAPVEGAVEHLGAARDGMLWATTQWQVEGTYPTLLRSRDGLSWRVVELPESRTTTGPAETLTRLCLRTGAPGIVLESAVGALVEAWLLAPGDAGTWARQPKVEEVCASPEPAAGSWTIHEGEEWLGLSRGAVAVRLPRTLRPR